MTHVAGQPRAHVIRCILALGDHRHEDPRFVVEELDRDVVGLHELAESFGDGIEEGGHVEGRQD